jgi:hypothetical protein
MTGVESRAWGDRSTLVLVEPSIASSTINVPKTTKVPLNLRTQGSSGASLNAWGFGSISGLVLNSMGDCDSRDLEGQGFAGGLAFFGAGVAVIIGDRSGFSTTTMNTPRPRSCGLTVNFQLAHIYFAILFANRS